MVPYDRDRRRCQRNFLAAGSSLQMGVLDVSQSHSMLTTAPRVTCLSTEMATITKDYGGGAGFGYAFQSEGGLRNIDAIISIDRMGTTTSTGIELNAAIYF